MIKRRNRTFITVLGLALGAVCSFGLDIGDRAPTLKGVKQWLNGPAAEPAEGDGKTVYVVEFWATWCGPCRTTIPHLNQLHKKLKDRGVVIIGVTTEDEATARPFMEKMNMSYRVALDTDRTTEETWMKDVEGIPHAFIVDRGGRVIWAGHPMDGLEQTLDDVLEGRFDPEKLRRQRADEAELMRALQTGEIARASATLDRLIAADSKNMELAQLKAGLLFQSGDLEGLKAHYQSVLKTFHDSAEGLNELAWMQVAPSPMPLAARDMGVAWAAARRAVELSERKDAAILDTLALVLFRLGLHDAAIATQEEAIQRASNAEERAELTHTLEHFKTSREIAAEARQVWNKEQGTK